MLQDEIPSLRKRSMLENRCEREEDGGEEGGGEFEREVELETRVNGYAMDILVDVSEDDGEFFEREAEG